jgi:cellulose synthase/poly-beta-1,6-N-acetylglucosamine synthase-like glycosyltransferase
MNSILWSLVPDSALPLVIVGVALALIVGVIKRRAAFSIIGFFVLSILLSPLFEVIFSMLPWWLTLLIGVGFAVAIARALMALVLGRRATDHMVGILAADAVRGLFRAVFLPFRLLGRIVR